MLQISIQIANGLDAAHHQGLIHRDLKPSNIMLTSEEAKLLDFGLAKLQLNQTDNDVSAVTQTTPLTGANTILGTMQYMAPEQLEGKEADVRSDIFSFGAIMYEMATGKRAFEGSSNATLIAAIIGLEPISVSAIIADTPPLFERLVKKCLSKDPRKRWQSVSDLSDELRWISQGGSQVGLPAQVAAKRKFKFDLARAIGAVAILSAATFAYLFYTEKTKPGPEAIQALIEAPRDARLFTRSAEIALSPDGRKVVFFAGGALWVRPLGSDAATLLPGTDGAFRPFWSPDSRTIAYFNSGKLMRVPVSGGSPTSVCDAVSGRGGSWNSDDIILFAPNLSGPIMQVSASGGDLVAVTTVDSARNESEHRFPHFLPDGDHFLFAALPGGPNGWDTYVGSLRSGAVKRLLTARSVAVYAEPGFLLFEREGRVLAQRFDTDRLELQGAPVAIADAPEPSDLDAEPVASASRNGRLAILRSEPPDTRLETRAKDGVTTVSYELPPGPWRVSNVTQDKRRAAIIKGDEIWVLDLVRSVPMLLSSDLASTPTTAWSPDGNQIAFGLRHDTREEIYIGDLGGKVELVPTTDDPFKGARDWSRDGRYLVFWAQNAETGIDLWILPMDGDRKPVPYLRSAADETGARISPDGRWLAYVSNETGNNEIYVQSFPEPGSKTRISIDGGVGPVWVEGGRRLVYFNTARRELVAIPVKEGDEFQPGLPSKFKDPVPNLTSAAFFDDGSALVSIAQNRRPRDIRIILNWTELLER
jgi:Tol biopolymer transport system component